MSTGSQMGREGRDHSSHHRIVEGERPGTYTTANILTTIVGALTDEETLREYWWDVTPDALPVRLADDERDLRTITWTLSGRLIDGSDDLPGFGFDHERHGVRITDPRWDGPQPKRHGHVYVLLLEGQQKHGTYQYSVFFKVNGRPHSIDPELEVGED